MNAKTIISLCMFTNLIAGLPQTNSDIREIADRQNFQLNSDGISHIYWPFPNSTYDDQDDWHIACGPNCGWHHQGDYYADDWNWGANSQDDCGLDFYSPISGTVIYAAWVTGYGNQVVVQSNDDPNFAFRIAHLNEISVLVNQTVSIGTKLGEIGDTGSNEYTCHAHCVLYKNINQIYSGSMTGLQRLQDGLSLGVSQSGDPNAFAAPYYFNATEPIAEEGWVSVSQGVGVNPSTVEFNENFIVDFTLHEIQGLPVTLQNVVVAIYLPNGEHLFDLESYQNVTIPANGSQYFSTEPHSVWYDPPNYDTPPGTYSVGINGRVSGEEWFTFTTIDGGVNPQYFQVNILSTENGWLSVSEGVTIYPNMIFLGDQFTISFSLTEINGYPVSLEEMTIAILYENGNHFIDFEIWNNETFSSNQTREYTSTGTIYDTDPGIYQAEIRGRISGGDWFTLTVIEGSAVNPAIFQVFESAGSLIWTPSSYTFPNTIVGETSNYYTFTLTNEGNGLTSGEVEATGDFHVTGIYGYDLEADESVSINVNFQPTALGDRTGFLIASSTNQPEVTLSGNGVLGGFLTWSPEEFSYPFTTVGQIYNQTFILTNEGDGDIFVNEITLTGSNYDQFEIIAGAGSFELGPGDTRGVLVAFQPTEAGEMTGNLHASSNQNDPDVILYGTGIDPLELIGELNGQIGPGFYTIIGDISTVANGTLTINPGTTFMFNGDYEFYIHFWNSSLNAIGTETDSIRFIPYTGVSNWGGLYFDGTTGSSGTSALEYCLVKGAYRMNNGGGIRCTQANLSLRHSRIIGNISEMRGGGMYVSNANPIIENCTFNGNVSLDNGGGIYFENSISSIVDCVINNNTASQPMKGGGVYCDNSNISFINCRIIDNGATAGGGIFCDHSSPIINSCIIAGNSADATGGGIYCDIYNSIPTIENCTISNNSSGGAGGLISNSGTVIVNTIFEGNTGNYGVRFYSSPSTHTVSYSDFSNLFTAHNFTGGPNGFGEITTTNGNGDYSDQYYNIFLDPNFVNPTNNDFHLQWNSPCIDAGDPGFPQDPDDTTIDIGVFFFDQINNGCMNPAACNYDQFASIDDGSCVYPEGCNEWCLGDEGEPQEEDLCGVCGGPGYVDCITLTGCESFEVCEEIDCIVADECGACGGLGAIYACGCDDIPEGDCDCDGNVEDECGMCGGDNSTCSGCTDPEAINYDPEATLPCNACCVYDPVLLSFGAVSYLDRTIEIMIDTPINVAGFQFDIVDIPEEIEITGATGGLAEASGFDVELGHNPDRIIGFSFSGNEIPSESNGILLYLTFTGEEETEICIENPTITYNYNNYYVATGECIPINNCIPGDLNRDGTTNVSDVVYLVACILNNTGIDQFQCNCAGDVNDDGSYNVTDVVIIVGWILNPQVLSKKVIEDVSLKYGNGYSYININNEIAGVELNISGDFKITHNNLSEGWRLYSNQEKILMFSLDGSPLNSEILFEYSGELIIESALIADWNGRGVYADIEVLPESFSLGQAYPNPFNPVTTFEYHLPVDAIVSILVFDLTGRQVSELIPENTFITAGRYTAEFNANDLPSGLYFVAMLAKSGSEEFTAKQKVVLLK